MLSVQRRKLGALIGGILATLSLQAIAQASESDQAAIRETLTKWTADFNAGNTQEICGLFSPDLLYDYQGQQERTTGIFAISCTDP